MDSLGHLQNSFVKMMILSQAQFPNVGSKEKQLDKDEFEEIGSMAAFKVLETQFQKFIKSRISLDDEEEFVKESIDKRALHKRECDSRVNERHMQTKEGKVDTSKALDASLVDTESRRTESEKQNTSNSSGNDTDADDADIKPVYDEEPMAEVQMTTECNVFAIGQQHTEQPEFNNEGGVDQDAEQCHNICPLPAHSKSVSTSTLKETYGSNDMIHNYYLDDATKKTQESGRNSRPSMMPSARSQSTANGSKPKPRINNQNSRNWPAVEE
ncbi:hypothetical protein Tco_0772349 [Tanacetum coccineum]|uniref:Uncharacterized protein n=1 Tax=Tanacetum coccineum TaxID=301880 RepID=A0ABQ4ZHN7_9ASTR